MVGGVTGKFMYVAEECTKIKAIN